MNQEPLKLSKNNTISVGKALNGILKDLGLQGRINQYRVLEMWPEIVGENIAKYTKAERVQENIIYIKVKNNTWRTELQFQKNIILENISQKVGKGIIKDIRFY